MRGAIRYCVIGCLLVASSNEASGVRITGGIILNQMPGPDIFSFADAATVDIFGDPVVVSMRGAHSIYPTSGGLYAARITNGTASISSFLRNRAEAGDCFAADWIVTAPGADEGYFAVEVPVCLRERPVPPDPSDCPVLLDLDLDGFHLSGPDPAVSFDIDADGDLDQIAWTQAGEDDAFLCLDRNQNGRIDDGSELFGYATPLLSGSHAVVGYEALSEFDLQAAGGNSDGRIDNGDAIFGDLCVWLDADRDGISQPSELAPLESTNVLSLSYDYRTTGIKDRHGNLFRYRALSSVRGARGQARSWPTYDVIFTRP